MNLLAFREDNYCFLARQWSWWWSLEVVRQLKLKTIAEDSLAVMRILEGMGHEFTVIQLFQAYELGTYPLHFSWAEEGI